MTFEEYTKKFFNDGSLSLMDFNVKELYNDTIPYAYTSDLKTKEIIYDLCNVKWKDMPIDVVDDWFTIGDEISEYVKKIEKKKLKITKLEEDFI